MLVCFHMCDLNVIYRYAAATYGTPSTSCGMFANTKPQGTTRSGGMRSVEVAFASASVFEDVWQLIEINELSKVEHEGLHMF